MDRKQILNRIARIALLVILIPPLLLFVVGALANIFGFADLRVSDRQITEKFRGVIPGGEVIRNFPGEGFQLAYVCRPATTATAHTAIFYVHGSPGGMDANTDYLLDSLLSAQATQYTYDRVGYGSSLPLRGEGDMSVQAAQLAALIRHVGAEQNILVGHSLGCTIAAFLAAAEPQLIDGIVLVAAPLDPVLEPSSWWRPILDFPVLRLGIPTAMRISNHELAPLKSELLDNAGQWDKIRCRVTLIHGDQDDLVSVRNVDFIRQRFTHAADVKEVILEHAGHFIYWSREDVVRGEILQMIEAVSGHPQQTDAN